MDNIREALKACPNEKDHLFLLHPFSEDYGFFSLNGKILFLSANDGEIESNTIETEKLSLATRVSIKSVQNMPTFKMGEYNYILFKGDEEDTDFDSFIRICSLYVNDSGDLSLKAFFFSIMSLFQMPKEQQYKNLLGIFGELIVLENVYLDTGISLASGWHTDSYDKYDFAIGNLILEVKTTSASDNSVQIKYDQLYSRDDIKLGTVFVEKSNGGITLMELIHRINSIEGFANNLKFQISLGVELKKISPNDADELRFDVKRISYYNNGDIDTIKEIPDTISDITYRCRLDIDKSISSDEVVAFI